MKVFLAIAAILGLATSQDWELSETGLCIEKMTSCPSRKQKYGICCKIKGVPRSFDNYCLACTAVSLLLFRVAINGNINSQILILAIESSILIV